MADGGCTVSRSGRRLPPAEDLVGGGPGSTALVPFTSSEGTMSAGLGARIALGSNVFVAPEFRLGWKPESRLAVTIGVRFR